jgi:hypothetical protein
MDQVKEKEIEKEPEDGTKKESEVEIKKEAEDEARKEAEDETRKEAEGETKKEPEDETKKEPEDETRKEAEDETKKEAEDETKTEPEDETNIIGYKDFLEKEDNNPNDQEKTSENTQEDGCSLNNKEQREDKSSIIDLNNNEMTTVFGNIDFIKTSLSEFHLILLGYVNTKLNVQKQKEGKSLIGNKR